MPSSTDGNKIKNTADLEAAELTNAAAERAASDEVLRLRDLSLAAINEGIVIQENVDGDSRIIYANAGFERITGYVLEEIRGRNCRFLQGADTDQATVDTIRDAIKSETFCSVELLNYRKDGTPFWNALSISPVRDATGKVTHYVGVQQDVSRRQLAEVEARQAAELRNLFQNANDAILIFDPQTEIVIDANDKACRMYGFEHLDFVGKSIRDISEDATRGASHLENLLNKGTQQSFETVQFRADGSPLDLLINSSIIEYQGKQVVLSINRDVTEQKKAQRDLQESRAQYQLLFDSNPHPVWVYDLKTLRFLACNDEMVRRYGYSREDVLAMRLEDIRSPEDLPAMLKQVEQSAADQNLLAFASRHRTKAGTIIDVEIASQPIVFAGKAARLVLATDVTERKRAEQQLLYDAFHDGLTGLANRVRFMDHLQSNIKRRKTRRGNLYAVLFLDLDRFKIVNDSLGHSEGDNLLKQTAQRLEGATRKGDLIARLGGDEFVILLNEMVEESDAARVAERIRESLKNPFELQGNEVFVTASIGIALSVEKYEKAEEMLRDADIAMYRAKAKGKAQYQIFDPAMRQYAASKLQFENELRRALDRKEFFLQYQPIIDFKKNRLTGFESLVRWQHPARGFVPPLEFIPVAEETGMIVPLGLWILRESCRQLRQWQKLNSRLADLTMSVNLSPKQFVRTDLAESIINIVAETGVDPDCLRLEITESHIMEDSETAIAIMNRLRSTGIKLSIDDFGTGYSSLNYLHRLPINYLKIDRSFVSQIEEKPENREIVRTIIMLAKNLNIEVIAEGIETVEQDAFLKSLECHFGQGYFYSKPLAAEQAGILINTFSSPQN